MYVTFNTRNIDHVGDIRTFILGRLADVGLGYTGERAATNAWVQAYHSAVGTKGTRVQRRITAAFTPVDSVLCVLVTTVGFGMGDDIPNIRRVIHWGVSECPVSPPPFLSNMPFRYIVPFCERENSLFIKLETCFLLWCTSYFLLHVMYAWVQIYLCITMQNMLAHAMFLTLFQKIEDLCLKNVPFSWFRQFAPKAQTEGGCLIRRAVPSDTSHCWINLNLLTQVTCLSCWQPRTVKNVSGELS